MSSLPQDQPARRKGLPSHMPQSRILLTQWMIYSTSPHRSHDQPLRTRFRPLCLRYLRQPEPGAGLVIVDQSQRRDAHAWLKLIERWQVSIISCVPALLEMMLTAAGHTPLPKLRLVMMGGGSHSGGNGISLVVIDGKCRFCRAGWHDGSRHSLYSV